jgi:hypothetical protein
VPWNEFLFPVLAGYVFINVFFLTRFRAQRHDGYRLVIESLLCGVFIFALARLATMWIHRTQWGSLVEHWMQTDGMTYPYAGTAFVAGVGAFLVARVANRILGIEWAKQRIIQRHDNGFLRLFHKALMESKMVSVTLASRKVYIGYVIRTPNFSPEEQFVGLLPVVSGYREKDTLELIVTTKYFQAIKAGTTPPHDFEVTLALGSIESASLFDPAAYPHFGGTPPEKPAPDRPALPSVPGTSRSANKRRTF